jgi:methionine-rich copper-binding protein CopC
MNISTRGKLLSVVLAVALSAGTLAATATADPIVLKKSTPRNGATVGKVPPIIRLTFSVKPSKPRVRVISPDGDNHAGRIRVSGRTVIVRVVRRHEKGKYHVLWRVSSPDGDKNSGRFSFTVRK